MKYSNLIFLLLIFGGCSQQMGFLAATDHGEGIWGFAKSTVGESVVKPVATELGAGISYFVVENKIYAGGYAPRNLDETGHGIVHDGTKWQKLIETGGDAHKDEAPEDSNLVKCGINPSYQEFCLKKVVPVMNGKLGKPIELEVRDITVGRLHACALTDQNEVYCWGANSYGQTGLGDPGKPETQQEEYGKSFGYFYPWGAGQVIDFETDKPLADVAQVEAGTHTTCAIIAGGNQLKCWGLLWSDPEAPSLFKAVTLIRTGDAIKFIDDKITEILDVEVGAYTLCTRVRVEDGTVHAACMGLNIAGDLGNGGFFATLATGLLQGSLNPVLHFTGTEHAALSSIPVDSTPLGYPEFLEAIEAEPIIEVNRLSQGPNHTCALLNNGQIKCWGLNHKFQTGSSKEGCATPIMDPENSMIHFLELEQVVQIFGGTGPLSTSATEEYDKLNLINGDFTDCQVIARLIEVSPKTFFVDVQSGIGHNCALTADDDVYCWGDNVYGQLGIGADTSQGYLPTKVTSIPKIKSLIVGANYSCFKARDDEALYCTGMLEHLPGIVDVFGQKVASPVQIELEKLEFLVDPS